MKTIKEISWLSARQQAASALFSWAERHVARQTERECRNRRAGRSRNCYDSDRRLRQLSGASERVQSAMKAAVVTRYLVDKGACTV